VTPCRTPSSFTFQTQFSRVMNIRFVSYLAVLQSVEPCIFCVIFSRGHLASFRDNGVKKWGFFFVRDFLKNGTSDLCQVLYDDVW
jgi:hypothetical protein